jgi:hypothetical protein
VIEVQYPAERNHNRKNFDISPVDIEHVESVFDRTKALAGVQQPGD